jgi:hypothetical protein
VNLSAQSLRALALLEPLGKSLALYANPQHYSFEDRYKADAFARPLAAARRAWTAIKGGEDPLTVLPRLSRDMGPVLETNTVARILDMVRLPEYREHTNLSASAVAILEEILSGKVWKVEEPAEGKFIVHYRNDPDRKPTFFTPGINSFFGRELSELLPKIPLCFRPLNEKGI